MPGYGYYYESIEVICPNNVNLNIYIFVRLRLNVFGYLIKPLFAGLSTLYIYLIVLSLISNYPIFTYIVNTNMYNTASADTVNCSKKSGFFKEQNAGFSAQIYRVTLTKTLLNKKTCYHIENIRLMQTLYL